MPEAEIFSVLRQHQPHYIAALRAQGHADADLSCPLRYRVGNHAVDSDACQDERQPAEQPEQNERDAPRGNRGGDHLLHRCDAKYGLLFVDRCDDTANRGDQRGNASRNVLGGEPIVRRVAGPWSPHTRASVAIQFFVRPGDCLAAV
jgi:hypothetical protein